MRDDGSRAEQAFEALRDAGVITANLCRRLVCAQGAQTQARAQLRAPRRRRRAPRGATGPRDRAGVPSRLPIVDRAIPRDRRLSRRRRAARASPATTIGAMVAVTLEPTVLRRFAQLLAPDQLITGPEQLRTYECDGLSGRRVVPGPGRAAGQHRGGRGDRGALPRAGHPVRGAWRRVRALRRRTPGGGGDRHLAGANDSGARDRYCVAARSSCSPV